MVSKLNEEAKKTRVALVYEYGIEYETATTHYTSNLKAALDRAKEKFGVEFDERLPSLPPTEQEITETIREFAESRKYSLIFAQGADLMGPAVSKVAPEFPDQKFAVVDGMYGYPNMPNVASYTSTPERDFLIAYILAMISETNTIGWVFGCLPYAEGPSPAYRRHISGAVAGAKYANPDIEVLYSFTYSWTNPYLTEKLALEQFDYNADMLPSSHR